MVSIEQRTEYLTQFKKEPLVNYFTNWLYGSKIQKPENVDYSNANDIALATMYYFSKNQKSECIECYARISNREPNIKSDWIYNDILIFTLVCAVKRFNLTKEWLKKVIDIRLISKDHENRLIAQSYYDILQDNTNSKNNLYSIIIISYIPQVRDLHFWNYSRLIFIFAFQPQ